MTVCAQHTAAAAAAAAAALYSAICPTHQDLLHYQRLQLLRPQSQTSTHTVKLWDHSQPGQLNGPSHYKADRSCRSVFF
jgi:hypothetical protein